MTRSHFNTLLACDFETYHSKDFEADGIDIRPAGNELHVFENDLDTGKKPGTYVKCAGLVAYSLRDTHIENAVEVLSGTKIAEECLDDLDGFLSSVTKYDRPIIYFHNAKFDELFIASELLRNDNKLQLSNGWVVSCRKRSLGQQGRFYEATYIFRNKELRKTKTVKVRDSAKLYAQQLRVLGKMVGIEKGYEALTPGMSDEIKEYCLQDCRILGAVMIQYFNLVRIQTFGAKKLGYMTSAGTAYNLWVQHCLNDLRLTEGEYRIKLPKDGHPDWLRQAYKGASPLLDKSLIWKRIEDVHVYDVNSMYPYQMENAILPYGEPEPVTMEELERCHYWLKGYVWVAKVKMHATVKGGHRPCFLLKSKNEEGETLEREIDSFDDHYITNMDLKLITENYDITYFEVLEAWKYKACQGVAKRFIDKWYGVKSEAKLNGNTGLEKFAKMILNSLYGKFGSRIEFTSYDYYLKDDGSIGVIEVGEEEQRGAGIIAKIGYYLPWAVWITANARYLLTKAINAVGWEHVCYTDTDSIHVYGISTEEAEKRLMSVGIRIGKKNLGDFDLESSKYKIDGVYIRNKGYAHFYGEDVGDHKKGDLEEMKMAGINEWPSGLTIDNLSKDTVMWQNKNFKVPGGSVIVPRVTNMDISSMVKSKKRKGMTEMETYEYDQHLISEYYDKYVRNKDYDEDMVAALEDDAEKEKDRYWKKHVRKNFEKKKLDEERTWRRVE